MSNLNLIQLDESRIGLTLDGISIGSMRVDIYRPGNGGMHMPFLCKLVKLTSAMDSKAANRRHDTVEWHNEAQNVLITLSLAEDNGKMHGDLTASGNGSALIRFTLEMSDCTNGFPFIPGFMYGYNDGGQSSRAMYPRLNRETCEIFAQPWFSDEWHVRADRSTHGFSSIIGDGVACAIGGRDVSRYPYLAVAEKNGLGIKGTETKAISFSLGFANMPYTYGAAFGRDYIGRPEGYVDLNKGDVKTDFFILAFKHKGRQEAAAKLLRDSYSLMHDQVTGVGKLEEGVDIISEALYRRLYDAKGRMFLTGWSEAEEITRGMDTVLSTGWAGGARTAFPLLAAGRILGNPDWLKAGASVMENIAVNARCEKTGLFFENYNLITGEWSTRGWWYGGMEKPGHSGYVNGQICHYLLQAYILEREHGVEQASWFESAKAVLDHVAAEQDTDGRFGYTYCEETGKILDGEGFSGCWFVPAFAGLYTITGDRNYLDVASRAMAFYRKYVEDFHVWGGPHDINKSPDEEGILAFIQGARQLHESTGDDIFFRDLMMGLDYEFSWKFSYNVVSEVEPLKSLNWCATGGSITSVNNSHIHPMGSQILDALEYAARISGDDYFKSRLMDTLRWTLTTYVQHKGQYGWGEPGLINERFCYTDSVLLERWPDGSPASTWFMAHSWASGAVLEGLTGIWQAVKDGRIILDV